MNSAGVRIETSRLLLRVPQAGDFDRFSQMLAHRSSLHIGGPMSRHEAWGRFLQSPGAWQLQGFAMFSVIEKYSGRWIGQAGPWRPASWPGTEIAYSLHPDARGSGYATEACAAALDYAFDVLGCDEIIHYLAPANAASQAVAMRLGSRNRGPGRLPPPLDVQAIEIWGQSRDEWPANRKRLRWSTCMASPSGDFHR